MNPVVEENSGEGKEDRRGGQIIDDQYSLLMSDHLIKHVLHYQFIKVRQRHIIITQNATEQIKCHSTGFSFR